MDYMFLSLLNNIQCNKVELIFHLMENSMTGSWTAESVGSMLIRLALIEIVDRVQLIKCKTNFIIRGGILNLPTSLISTSENFDPPMDVAF